MKNRIPFLLAAVSLLGAAMPALADDPPQQDPAMSRPPMDKDGSKIPERLLKPELDPEDEDELDGRFAFDYLKKLAGSWAPGTTPEGASATRFSVAGGGTVLIGTSSGAAPEIVSIFHVEEEELTITIYDPAGAQPRLKFDPNKSHPGRYYFKFAGGTGFDKSRDRHIHEASIQFRNVNEIAIEWVTFDGMSRSGSTVTSLVRAAAAAGGGSE